MNAADWKDFIFSFLVDRIQGIWICRHSCLVVGWVVACSPPLLGLRHSGLFFLSLFMGKLPCTMLVALADVEKASMLSNVGCYMLNSVHLNILHELGNYRDYYSFFRSKGSCK